MKKKFVVWTEKSKETHSEENCYLRLEQSNDKNVTLVACDVEGERIKSGNLLILDSEFKVIVVMNGVSENIPLKTDLDEEPLIYNTKEFLEIVKPELRFDITDMMKRVLREDQETPVKQTTIN